MSKARNIANSGTALGSVSPTELAALDGVTSAIQTQINNVLPTQSGQSGKYLKTDGTSKSWETVSQYALPSMTGKAGKYLTTDGTVESWAAAAQSTETFSIGVARKWLDTGFSAATYYAMSVSAGTATVFLYDGNTLVHAFDVTGATTVFQVTTPFTRMEAQNWSTSADLAIVPTSPKITSAKNATLTLDWITASGNYGEGSGNATGGTSGYAAGQVAHVMVVGGGAGGGAYGYNNNYNYQMAGGGGGGGGVAYNNTPITLTGTYSLVVGSYGAPGNGSGSNPQAGSAGGTSTGFGLTANGGNGGSGAIFPNEGIDGTGGTPTIGDTQIFKPATYTKIGYGAGGAREISTRDYSPFGRQGQMGAILVLRWTP